MPVPPGLCPSKAWGTHVIGEVRGGGRGVLGTQGLKGQRAGPVGCVISRGGQQGARADRGMGAPPARAVPCNRACGVSAARARAREEAVRGGRGPSPTRLGVRISLLYTPLRSSGK